MTSMIKRVDVGVFDFIKSASEGKAHGQPDLRPEERRRRLLDLRRLIDDIKAKLDDYKQQIIERQDQGADDAVI